MQMEKVYHCGMNKRFSSKFPEGYTLQEKIPEEGQKVAETL